MSLITPTFTVVCACALPQANAAAKAAILTRYFIAVLLFDLLSERPEPAFPLNPQVLVELFQVGVQFRIGKPLDDAAMFHDVIAVRDGRGEAEILFNEQDGKSLLLERADGAADLLDDDGRELIGRLVDQQQPG